MWGSIAISDFLTKSESWVPVEPDGQYKQITARLWGKGLTLRGEVPGSAIAAARQYCAKAGQFLLSRIDARHGAYGIVPEELDGALVSNDFPCFDIDASKVLPHYFEWYSRTPEFIDLCRRASEGSTNRVRMKEDKFLRMMVPLPSLGEQRRIVEKLDRVAALVDERRSAIEAAERETQALLLKAFQRAIDGAPLRPMAEVAPLVRRPVEIDLDASYPELGVRSFGRGTFHKPDLLGADLSWQKLFLVQQGDLVFSNIKAWEGAFAVAGPDDHGRVGSHRYLTCVPTQGLATADFIWFYLQTSEGLGKVQSASPGSADRNRTLGQGALEAITVPTPPIGRQQWFNRLHARAREARTIRASTAQDVQALIPAMLHETFGRQHQAA
ncbi:restriction endonuclease subunit S [Cereibacter sphaeroides]|uniref:Restriction endonuclease subunit S n=2 Tax=Alphaproteobacteria TaxID=28211 RepID=A0A7X3K2H0_9HYPH|nr:MULTISPECIES: restriction endonuclease subunit S [Alphaproteobacteria]MVS98422.1 restriction endonuclease subunit S [Devosia marina]RHZ91828.1 restriction endonuclease subunit S [Cereibacter sphaeroides]